MKLIESCDCYDSSIIKIPTYSSTTRPVIASETRTTVWEALLFVVGIELRSAPGTARMRVHLQIIERSIAFPCLDRYLPQHRHLCNFVGIYFLRYIPFDEWNCGRKMTRLLASNIDRLVNKDLNVAKTRHCTNVYYLYTILLARC